MKKLALILLVATIATAGYLWFRQGTIGRLDGELRTARAKVAQQQALQQQLVRDARLLDGRIDMAAFVEQLYARANRTGIDDIEVMTTQQRALAAARQARPLTAAQPVIDLKTSRLQVIARSDYRSLAEYLREIDEIPGTKRVTRLEMAGEGAAIRMLVMIDLYALKGASDHVR